MNVDFQKVSKIDLFHVPIFITELASDNIGALNSKLTRHVYDLEKQSEGRQLSNAGGWQSEAFTKNNSDPDIESLLQTISQNVKNVYDYLQVDSSLVLANYWFSINRKYNYNKEHSHPFGYFSCVYYIKCPKNGGRLIFMRPDIFTDTVPFKESTPDNWYRYWVEPSAGMLVIFPSFLRHFVEQNLSEDTDCDRISLSINFR